MKKIIRGAIFYVDLDPIVGSEQGGKNRPVLIIQNDKGNTYSPTVIVAPITKKIYEGRKIPTHINIKQFDEVRPNSIVMLEQIRTIDKKRLKGFVSIVDDEDMKKVDRAIRISLGLNKNKSNVQI